MHGIAYDDNFLQSLPVLLPRPAPHQPIRALTAAQFADLHRQHLLSDTPDSILFPFLHGLEGDNQAQLSFFGGKPESSPAYRGLAWVETDEVDDEPREDEETTRRHRVRFDDFQTGDFDEQDDFDDEESRTNSDEDLYWDSSDDEALSEWTAATSPASSEGCQAPSPQLALTSAFAASDLLNGSTFIPPRVPDGISLRNFGIQVPVYATLCDIVVYSRKGASRNALALAERFKHAIETKYAQRDSKSLVYNVFVIVDELPGLQEALPHLLSNQHYVDFPLRERQEMQNLTRASLLIPGIWLGNAADVSTDYDLCVECYDTAPFPCMQRLGNLKQVSFPASPHLSSLPALLAFVSFLITQAGNDKRILLFSIDGYTETSVLALCLLMAQRGLSLPESYVALQVESMRSFFVYPSDLTLLRRVEAKMRRPTTIIPTTRKRSATTPILPSEPSASWFSAPGFDGSFPSRVLPFLYLGNLNHACNANMLRAIGITHVVSVGESAIAPPPPPKDGSASPSAEGSLYMAERQGSIKVLDIAGVCDDGIDSLQPQLAPICTWIEDARKSGGKILVHCRVGVSRSATVVIAYVMAHLGLSLVDAYLLVRSRRLSVLIQPNMRLLYNLLGWEVALARHRDTDEDRSMALSKCLNWPYLAREVHRLNEKYLR